VNATRSATRTMAEKAPTPASRMAMPRRIPM
jgi:hypothetical protein